MAPSDGHTSHSHGTRLHSGPTRLTPTADMAYRIAGVLLLAASVAAICDNQRANVLLKCSSACQWTSLVSSSGCGLLGDEECYRCCWKTCVSGTIEGGTCGTFHGTQEYEKCILGGSCLVGSCLAGPSDADKSNTYTYGGGDFGDDDSGIGGGPIAGMVVGCICALLLIGCIVHHFCKPKVPPDQIELTPTTNL